MLFTFGMFISKREIQRILRVCIFVHSDIQMSTVVIYVIHVGKYICAYVFAELTSPVEQHSACREDKSLNITCSFWSLRRLRRHLPVIMAHVY